jgi:hypothetical protein
MPENCPDAIMLAAFVDSALTEFEAQRIEHHLVRCKTCREIIALTIKSRRAVPDPDPN